MLAATERSVEISRQRRTQLRFVGVSNTADCRLKTSSRFSNQPNSQRDVKRVDTAATNAALKRVGMSTAEDGVQRSIGGITSGNSASSRAISNDNRKLNNTNKQLRRVRIRRHNSVTSNSVTPPETWTVESPESCVLNVDGAVAQEPLLIATPQRSVFDVAMRGVQPELSTRRWSSVQELSGHKASTQSPGIRTDRGSVQRRGGRGRQLDRHVYQCYFAGILHSTRPSDRFLRLQQMFAVLENIVEIETELFSGQRGPTPSQIDRRQSASQGVDATLNLSNRKYRLQRTLELQKLYAKLNTAQDGKEFFYDTGHLDAFQWKPWMDFGLNRKINSMTRLKEVFENAVVNGHCVSSTTTLTPLAQKCERGLSFGKVLGMFRRLEKRSRKETGARFRSQTSSQQSLDSIQKLEGTYIKMMESAARNAKTMALHGYHMNEHRNRYDAYVQSRRIYRPKSASNIFEKVSSDEDEIRTVTSSSTPPTTTGFSYSTRHHKQPSDMLAKPGSATMECPQIFSPARFVSTSTKCSEAATQVQDSLDSWATNHQLCQSVVSATAAKVANDHTLEGIQCGNTTPGRSLTVDDGRVAEELKHTTVLYGANSAAKSRKRDRQRPRCRNAHGRRTRSVNSGVGVAEPHSSAQRHIDVWRSSLCPPPGTINQVLDYFNSLCIEDSNDKKDHSTTKECNYSVNSLQSRDQINSVKNSKQLTTQLPTSTNNEKRSTSPPHVDCKRKFSTKVQQNVDDDDVLVVSEDKWQDMALPQLHSCNDEVRGAEFSTSSVSTVSPAIYSRAVNIDKRRRPLCVVDSVEVNSERPRYPGTDAKRPEVETDDYWAMSTQSDVVAGVEVSPMYVASPEVVQMLSESQQIQRNDAMSPVFIDCRHAVTRELHVHKSAWEPYANHLPSYNCASLSAGKRDNTTVSTLTVSSGKLPDSARSSANNQHQEMINNRCRLTKTSEIPNMGEGAGVSQQTCSSADETRASFVTTVSSPSFLCSACHQSLAVCNCASTAEARAPRGGKGWWNDANQDSVVKFISVKAAGDLALNVSRAGSELDVIRGRHQCQVTGVLDPALSERRPIPSETRGRHDAELWRMLNSLETINSEWTNGRPTRSTQILHPPVEMNSASQTQLKSNINDEHAETAVRVVECDDGFDQKYETSPFASYINGRTDHDRNTPDNTFPSSQQLVGNTANIQDTTVQRLCVLYNYNPRHPDELELKKGDIIYLADVCDDGWFWGTSEQTKQFGTFPGNFVRPIT